MRIKVRQSTKREFKENKEYYREQGIKSSIGLQKYKNELTKIKREQRANERAAIREAFARDAEKLETIGYTEEDFIEYYNQIVKYNQKIEKSKKSKYISPTTALFNFPIDRRTGKISLSRLSNVIQKINSRSMRDIARVQRRTFFNNIRQVYGPEVEQYARNELSNVPYGHIVDVFRSYDVIDYLVIYDIEAFDDEAQDYYWKPLENRLGDVYDAIIECKGGLVI